MEADVVEGERGRLGGIASLAGFEHCWYRVSSSSLPSAAEPASGS